MVINLWSTTVPANYTELSIKHPLQTCTNKIIHTSCGNTCFAHLILALPKAETINPIAYPPWIVQESRSQTAKRISGPQGCTKERAAEDFIEFLTTIPPNGIQVFSDGSKSEATDGATGSRSVTFQHGHKIDCKAFSLGRNTEVFDAEASAALCGAKQLY